MQLTWLGHSGFELALATGEVILFDPWLGNPKYPANYEIQRADAILLSHGHFDHTASVAELASKHGSKVVAIFELAEWLEQAKGVKNVIGMSKGGDINLEFATATMVHAQHSSSIMEDGKIIYLGEPAGFVVAAEGQRIYFAGDTSVFGDMRLIAEIHGPIDIAILPIGGFYTMGPKEASFACRLMRPRKVIPMHYGTFPPLTGTPDALAALIADLPSTEVIALTPGVPAAL
jgi:L-ascorbate metabolism protein UlaG (beta-lactamase superfamily)